MITTFIAMTPKEIASQMIREEKIPVKVHVSEILITELTYLEKTKSSSVTVKTLLTVASGSLVNVKEDAHLDINCHIAKEGNIMNL
ncbi:Hypothetical predicted protein [Octopus vulgaris]|uniref:Uncharacterized protein n=1 Tax=Octopus vulgaris TaxID=6645 RepID=A0AA36AMT1_OCTVU|nr:Hypothetical predicted protein [Octopus vulgaris]